MSNTNEKINIINELKKLWKNNYGAMLIVAVNVAVLFAVLYKYKNYYEDLLVIQVVIVSLTFYYKQTQNLFNSNGEQYDNRAETIKKNTELYGAYHNLIKTFIFGPIIFFIPTLITLLSTNYEIIKNIAKIDSMNLTILFLIIILLATVFYKHYLNEIRDYEKAMEATFHFEESLIFKTMLCIKSAYISLVGTVIVSKLIINLFIPM